LIVVDTNVIAYCWLHGERTAQAHRLRQLDAEWHAPVLWRSEFRNVLSGYRRDGSLDGAQLRQIMAAAESMFAGREHHLPSDRVFALVEQSRISAYDAECVALAEILGVTLVTEDRAILSAYPNLAVNIESAVRPHRPLRP
jgi:predicted nucleic acid-binding protein